MQIAVLVIAEEDDGIVSALSSIGLLASRADSVSAARATTGEGFGMFDLVIVDAALPDGDGVDYCAGLRLQGFQGPIVLIGSTQAAEPSLAHVVDSWLAKPVELRDLLACVAQHVSRITALR